jgi:hypothetical protein
MTSESYRPPRLRTIGLGIAFFVLLLILVCSLSQGVKWAGAALLFLPERVGLTEPVHRAEVTTVDMQVSPQPFAFPEAQAYHVYTSDYDLLVISDELARSRAPAWLTITRAETGAHVPVTILGRGLMPYDSPWAAGRPVLAVQIGQAGTYVLDFPTRKAKMTLVPDRTTGREPLIFTAFAVQLAVLAAPFALALYRRELRLRDRLRARRRSSQEKFARLRDLAQPSERPSDDR